MTNTIVNKRSETCATEVTVSSPVSGGGVPAVGASVVVSGFVVGVSVVVSGFAVGVSVVVSGVSVVVSGFVVGASEVVRMSEIIGITAG
jgi:hypothetical protein